jgi:hypothetical protein
MMKLVKLPVANVWSFLLGDTMVPMGEHGRSFPTRKSAVAAANKQGIAVSREGKCVGAKGLNLDCCDAEHLMVFWAIFHRPTRSDAEMLVGDRRPGFTNIAATLAAYACDKATAIGCRERGDIRAAEIYERHCELTYERIPADCRW